MKRESEEAQTIVPPLKWAGGKRWFAARHMALVPSSFGTYLEPFFGSGALFFALAPKKAVLSDLNAELMNLYRVMRDDPDLLRAHMRKHQRMHSLEYYYQLRDFSPRTRTTRAARTLYLNRTCWNGLYRVNKMGEFNVPIGTKTSVLLETDDFHSISGVLKNCKLLVCDFEKTINLAVKGDLVFADPPYTVSHNSNGFIKYNERIFSWGDQERLAACVKRAVDRGVKVIVTNASHKSIHKLYRDFERIVVGRSGVIAGNATARGNYDEVVIRCF
jgi:DNA adenine methylase